MQLFSIKQYHSNLDNEFKILRILVYDNNHTASEEKTSDKKKRRLTKSFRGTRSGNSTESWRKRSESQARDVLSAARRTNLKTVELPFGPFHYFSIFCFPFLYMGGPHLRLELFKCFHIKIGSLEWWEGKCSQALCWLCMIHKWWLIIFLSLKVKLML